MRGIKRYWSGGLLLLLCISVLQMEPAAAGPEATADSAPLEVDDAEEYALAPVTLDGGVLFRVRGIADYPAAERAEAISGRIQQFAADRSVPIDSVRMIEGDGRTDIVAADHFILAVTDLDVAADRVPRRIRAGMLRPKIAEAVASYRDARSPRSLVTHTAYALGATLVLIVMLFVVRRLFRVLVSAIEKRLKVKVEGFRAKAGHIVRTESLWVLVHGLITAGRVLATLLLIYMYLQVVLGLYPWTRYLSRQLLTLMLDPLRAMGAGVLHALPGLAFIAVLIVVVRYLLKIMQLFLAGIAEGKITVSGFDPDWAQPTERILRVLVIAFAAVVAYPYIPGSGSEAFKGVSIFLGVIFSLGSSSLVTNMVAGYTMIYRRTFKVGDRVQIGDILGDVAEAGVLATHVRTVKNENVVVPNSLILGSSVKNFSTMAKPHGLILHTTVGIGYEVPWRQVEAMLKLAAERTPGFLRDPAPFVLQKALGDFAVTYELNVYTDDPREMITVYSALHSNVLDVFNEYGVQIMTPAYEGDPAEAKMVSKARWFTAPAGPPAPPEDGPGHSALNR
jgi:small-conductance mechanosensitive channel